MYAGKTTAAMYSCTKFSTCRRFCLFKIFGIYKLFLLLPQKIKDITVVRS